jgi:hypothetical protein
MDYFLRFIESDKPAVRALGILLGELHNTDDDSLVGNGFVLIGHLYAPTGETILDDDGNVIELREAIKDPNGNPYIHANLRTNQDLGATVAGKIAYLQNQIVKELEMAELPPDEDEETGEIVDTRPYYLNRVARMESDVAKWQETLSNLGKYFLLDEEGNARTPKQPQQVFA